MSWIKTISLEILGLFVDDVTFALAILAWVALSLFFLPHLGLTSPWQAIILFLGLAAILLESTLRYSRKKK